MSDTNMIRDLRALTQAGMKDCKDALVETNWDLNKAVDVIKTKGKLVAAGSRVASEGLVSAICINDENTMGMVEVNCVTDFVANSKEFRDFCDVVASSLAAHTLMNVPFQHQCDDIEDKRKELQSITKENIVVRRWWVEQTFTENGRIFSYVHPNAGKGKIGVLLSAMALTKDYCNKQEFSDLCYDLAMQVAAMNPLAVSPDKLDPVIVERQQAIFKAQIEGMNKPAAAFTKIMDGKMNKWYTEVCLLNQESVIHPKISVAQVLKNVEHSIGEVRIINFIRCQVGEDISKPVDNFADEVAQMAGE